LIGRRKRGKHSLLLSLDVGLSPVSCLPAFWGDGHEADPPVVGIGHPRDHRSILQVVEVDDEPGLVGPDHLRQCGLGADWFVAKGEVREKLCQVQVVSSCHGSERGVEMRDRKVWFVTGALHGMGACSVRAALAAGHAGVATARRLRKIAELRAEMDAYRELSSSLVFDADSLIGRSNG
jgi:hypothetical protein